MFASSGRIMEEEGKGNVIILGKATTRAKSKFIEQLFSPTVHTY